MEKNRVKSADIKELQARKKALKQEMEQIQSEIETSLNDVRNSVSDRAHFRFWAENYPLHIIGSAIVAGFVLARKTGSKKKSGTAKTSSGGVFTGLLIDEIKKMATQKAVRHLMQRIEEAIDRRNDKPE